MTPEAPTIRSVMLDALHSPPMGTGRVANAYHFPAGYGLEGFVLREEQNVKFRDQLTATTALIPFAPLLQGPNIGQPLMHLDLTGGKRVSVLIEQPGIRLASSRIPPQTPLDATSPYIDGLVFMNRVLNVAKRSGSNPFVALLDQCYKLSMSGYTPDLNTANILIDDAAGTIGLVDQTNLPNERLRGITLRHGRRQALRDKFALLLASRPDQTAEAEPPAPYTHAARQIAQLIGEACAEVTARHASHATEHGFAFGDVASIKAVALGEPPQALVQRLRELRSIALEGRQ